MYFGLRRGDERCVVYALLGGRVTVDLPPGVNAFHCLIFRMRHCNFKDEDDSFAGMATTDDYAGEPHIRVVTWLHVAPHGKAYEQQHRAHLRYSQKDRHRFVAMKNETFRHPRQGEQSRRQVWACAMSGRSVTAPRKLR